MWDADAARAADAFHAAHAARYGHQLDLPVELVTLRVRVEAAAPDVKLGSASDDAGPIVGPAAFATADSTLWVAAGWTAARDAYGNWLLSRQA